MWPDIIIMSPPCLDQDFGFGNAVEDFAIKQLMTQAAVERFTIAILPPATWGDVKRLDAYLSQPFLDGGCDKFGTVV